MEERIVEGLKKALSEMGVDTEPTLLKTPDSSKGDLAFACFPLAKALRMAPSQIALELQGKMAHMEGVESVQVMGGYLNFFLDKGLLFQQTISEILEAQDAYGNSSQGHGQKVMVEYSSPNTNKPQHLGHIRNNVLGMAVSHLLESQGYQVIKANLINDRGIHICKSMLAWQQWGNGATPESTGKKGDHLVGDFYVLFEQQLHKQKGQFYLEKKVDSTSLSDEEKKKLEREFLTTSPLMQQAQDMLLLWEAGDRATVDIWSMMNGWVYDGFAETYRELGCEFDKVYHESDTYTLGKSIISEGLSKGVFEKRDDGSVWFDGKDINLDKKLVLRKDGTSVYMTQDLGTAVMKVEDAGGLAKSIYVVGSEQDYHFKMLFHIMEKLGYPWASGMHHLSYGMVYLPEGRMKSREGKVVDADDLILEVKTLARERILSSPNHKVPTDKIDEVAAMIGIGALKYYMLKMLPVSDFTYNPEESIAFEGDTGPYSQYTHARTCSILRQTDAVAAQAPNYVGSAEEIEVLKLLAEFPAIVKAAAETYNPSKIANILFDVSKAFNRFYKHHHILSDDNQERKAARLALVKATGIVIRKGLSLLGIQAPEVM